MALIKRATGDTSSGTKKAKTDGLPIQKVDWELPTELSEPSNELGDYSFFIYGEKKIGKTTLAARFPNAVFLMFEPGGKALRIYQRAVNSWPEFQRAVKLLMEDETYQTVVVDTVDIAYDMCFDHMCRKLGIEHPHDEKDYGKSWGQIEKEFIKQFSLLLGSGKGVVFISHAQDMEISSRSGSSFSKVVPTVAKQALRYLEATVDVWGYYGYDETARRLYIVGDEYVGAGNRVEHHFLTEDGDPVVSIPMGANADEAYANLISAFNNEQAEVGPHPVKQSKSENRRR